MSLGDIKRAINEGLTVYWKHPGYRVVLDSNGDYLVVHEGGSCIGLVHKDGVTMNGDECDFYEETTRGDA